MNLVARQQRPADIRVAWSLPPWTAPHTSRPIPSIRSFGPLWGRATAQRLLAWTSNVLLPKASLLARCTDRTGAGGIWFRLTLRSCGANTGNDSAWRCKGGDFSISQEAEHHFYPRRRFRLRRSWLLRSEKNQDS